MTAHELLSRLRGVKRNGEGWQALCPAHEDRNPSLSVKDGSTGGVLLHCFAGCSRDSVCAALGVDPRLLEPDEAYRSRRASSKARREPCRIVATYDYSDETRKLLFQVVRFEPKQFQQRQPDSNGGWIWNVKGVRRVLYRLPEILAADPSSMVFICEGEKDADRLAALNLVATTNPGGAGKWPDEYREPLRDRNVCILPDNDDAGRKHTERVASSLRGVASSVRILNLRDLPQKGDVSDWLDAGGTAEGLEQLAANTPIHEWSDSQNVIIEPESDEEILQRLAGLPLLEYERQRENAAKALGCRTAVLDKLVDAKRRNQNNDVQGSALEFEQIEPWPEPVDGAEVLNLVAETFSRYVVLPAKAADALALWVLHAYIFHLSVCSPRLNITSPEKGCGKTTLRDVIACLVPRPLATENLTSAVLFRVIESYKPTLLADECDAWINDNEELRGLLNAGHRAGGKALRCDGEKNEVRAFNVFAPALLAGIGTLPGTLQDRSIVIRLERAKPGEVRERFDSRKTPREQELCRKLARFCADNSSSLEACDPVLPPNAFNRVADNWRPLLAIAEIAGGDWPQRARAAFASLVSTQDADAQGIGTMLLSDIQKIFKEANKERIFSKALVSELCDMTDRPWPEANHRSAITENWLARRLKPFGILSKTLRIDAQQAKGYERSRFSEAFARYLPDQDFSNRNTVPLPVEAREHEASKCPNENGRDGSRTDDSEINDGSRRWDTSDSRDSATGEKNQTNRVLKFEEKWRQEVWDSWDAN
jgi:hypothetical protein